MKSENLSEHAVLEIHSLARLEGEDAAEYYESHRRGLGERFLDALQETFARIALAPQEQPPWTLKGVPAGVRQSMVRGFEFAVVFVTEPRLLALAVRHQAQHPTRWLGRFDQE